MNVYLLIDNQTDEILNVYKYSEVALLHKERKSVSSAINKTLLGETGNDRRVEVMKVIEQEGIKMKHWDDSQQTAFVFLLNGIVITASIYTLIEIYKFFTTTTIVL